MFLQLVRTETNYLQGKPVQTIGWLHVHDQGKVIASFATLELPWNDNASFVSCIPPEPGEVKDFDIELLDHSRAFNYPHYWIKDVPGREGIKIHRGNYYEQIEGCILIGESHKHKNSDGVIDIHNSVQALNKLISLAGKKNTLQIKSLANIYTAV